MAGADPRTPLTYYGGKQLLAAQIVALMPSHRSYLEPFAGGAATLFAKPRAERETLNDLDDTIMRFWRTLREQPAALAAAVAGTPYGRREWRDSRDQDVADDVEAARRLLVEIDQSFSRSRRSWSVPCVGAGRGRWQPTTWANLPPKLLGAAERLQGVALEHGDAVELISRWDVPDALIYCDPPYTGRLRRRRNGSGAGGSHGYRVDDDGMLWTRLVDRLTEIEHAAVILSGYPCIEAERLGWQMVRLDRKRTAQARAGGTLPSAPEVVWLSPGVHRAPAPLSLLAAPAVTGPAGHSPGGKQ
jgi:DNA adenine methylase